MGRNAMSEEIDADEIGESTNTNSVNRRRFVKALGATTGSAALTSAGIGSASAESQHDAKKVVGERSNKVSNSARNSEVFEEYKQYFSSNNIEIDQNNPVVYDISDSNGNEAQVVSFSIANIGNNERDNGDLTFKIQKNTLVDHGATTQYWMSDTRYQFNKHTVTNNGISTETVNVDITEDESGDRSGVTMTHNPDSKDERQVTTVADLNPQPSISVGCGTCKTVFNAICQVGCSANTGLICTIATGGIGAIACGVAASLICSYIAVPNNCNFSDLPVGSAAGACRQAGAC